MAAVAGEAELCFPELLNSSCRRIKYPPSTSVLISITLSSVSVLTVTLNLLVIISISHFKRLHTPANLLLLSLAVSDCMVGLLISLQISLIDGCWFLGDAMCVLYWVLDHVITSASIGTMVLISVDRYVAIFYPLHYPGKVTLSRARLCVALCWIGSALFHCLLLMEGLRKPGLYASCSGECVLFVDPVGGLCDLLFSFVGPVSVTVVLYLRVFVVVVTQARAMRAQRAQRPLGLGARSWSSEAKAVRTLAVVVAAFLVCTCPFFCVTLAARDAGVSAASVAVLLFYFNSTLNPLIYTIFYPWFRRCVRLIATLQILRPGSSDMAVV
ncbi:trace amine-associated receptor 13c-like [Menidia menidia]